MESRALAQKVQRSEENLTFPIPPYSLMCYQDEAGAWKTKRYPEGMVRCPDPSYYACDLKPEIK